jgi:hypothetical protein
LLLVLVSAIILRSDSRETHGHILLSQIRDFPNLEGQDPVFISPLRNRVAKFFFQALDSLFVASYDSQDYGYIASGRINRKHHFVTTPLLLYRCGYLAVA